MHPRLLLKPVVGVIISNWIVDKDGSNSLFSFSFSFSLPFYVSIHRSVPIHSFNCPFSACIFFEIIYIILSLVSPLPTVVEQPAQPTVDEVAQRRIADLEAQVQRISTELSDVLEKEVRPLCDIEALPTILFLRNHAKQWKYSLKLYIYIYIYYI